MLILLAHLLLGLYWSLIYFMTLIKILSAPLALFESKILIIRLIFFFLYLKPGKTVIVVSETIITIVWVGVRIETSFQQLKNKG